MESQALDIHFIDVLDVFPVVLGDDDGGDSGSFCSEDFLLDSAYRKHASSQCHLTCHSDTFLYRLSAKCCWVSSFFTRSSLNFSANVMSRSPLLHKKFAKLNFPFLLTWVVEVCIIDMRNSITHSISWITHQVKRNARICTEKLQIQAVSPRQLNSKE
mgnify:CR=1 FL=1